MNGRFRKILFWLHLIAGVGAGVVILIMSATGVAIVFEKEFVAWAERDERQITPPPVNAAALGLDELLTRLREEFPGERPSAITLEADPTLAVAISYGRTNSFYVNPYSGEIRAQGAPTTRAFMHTMTDLHRFLGGHEEKNRALGKAITGAGNVAFLFLAVSGLYLWWPRQWTKKILASVGLLNFKLRGKARDFNWHNAVGLWCAPVLIVLTATAMPISYRWASDLIYKLSGSPVPTQGGPGGGDSAPVEIPTPPPGSKPLGLEAMFAAAQKELPRWQQITYRSCGRGGGRPGSRTQAAAVSSDTNAAPSNPESNREGNREGGERRRESRAAAQPIVLSVKEQGQWPLFASTQLTLDPYTGAILRQETFGAQSRGRQIRSWTRFLHTGEALGFIGKVLAGLASAGAILLVWTGLALSFRRFFLRKSRADDTPAS